MLKRIGRRPALVALALGLVFFAGGPAGAQDRARSKEVVVALAAEPRSLLPNTIVDWTTNNQLEHMYDRLVDRDPKTYKPAATMLATGWWTATPRATSPRPCSPPGGRW